MVTRFGYMFNNAPVPSLIRRVSATEERRRPCRQLGLLDSIAGPATLLLLLNVNLAKLSGGGMFAQMHRLDGR